MNQLYEFGDFRVHPAEQLLLYQGQPVPLTPKVFETLVILLESDGRLIDKNDFIDKLWPGVFVEDVALAQNISHLRKALGDGANGTAVIQTVPKRGYRFVVPVRRVADQPTEPPRAQSPRPPVPPGSADPIEDTEDAPALALTAPLWRRALPWVLLGMTALALAGLAFDRFREKPPSLADLVRFQIALPEKTSSVNGLALSPDGRHLAFATITQDGATQLWLRDLDSPMSRPLSGTDGASYPFWSPDSRVLAFASKGKLKRVDIPGGTPQVICPTDDFFGGAWSPDGVIVFGSDKGLMRVSAAGGEPSILIKVRHSLGPWLGFPSFLPDGRHFLYLARTASGAPTYVGSLDAEGEQPSSNPLVTGPGAYVPASGAGAGNLLFIRSGHTLVAQPFDASRLELKGDPHFVADGVNGFAFSANGVLAYIGGNATPLQLTWFDRRGNVLGTVGEPGVYPTPAISPDGSTVAVPLCDRSSGRIDLWLYNLERGNRRFTLDGTLNLYPVWSPDGSRIAFFSSRQGTPAIYQKSINGVGQEEVFKTVLPNIITNMPLDWSRDGRYFIEGVMSDTYSIWALPLSPGQEGGEHKPIPLVNESYNAINAKLSPDGKWIAYDSDQTGQDEIVVRTFPNPGGKSQVSTNGGNHPVWSRDAKELYYIASDGNLMAVSVKSQPDGSFDHGAAKVLFNPHTAGPNRVEDMFDVAKDGRFLIPVLTQQDAAPITVIVNWRAQMGK